MEVEVTYGHLSGEGILMEFKDILKAEQLSLTFFIVLDSLEVPMRTPRSATEDEIESEAPDLVWTLASYPMRICCCLYTCRAYINSSMEPAPSSRNTSTSRDWPIRKARSIACRSWAGSVNVSLAVHFEIPGGETLTPVWIYPSDEAQ